MKIPNPYFQGVPQYGDLTMEQIIVDYDYPLLFVLLDKVGNRYLCMCFDTRGAQQWLLTPVSNADLAALLRNETTLSAPFVNNVTKKILAVRNYKTGIETFTLYDADKIPKEDLPGDGECLDAEPGEWDAYITTSLMRAENRSAPRYNIVIYSGKTRTRWHKSSPSHTGTGVLSVCCAV